MTARDVTGFYANFSARESGNFLHILGGVFFTELHIKPGEKGQTCTGENSKNPVETAGRNRRFLSLVVVKRVLINMVSGFLDFGESPFYGPTSARHEKPWQQ